MAPDLAIEDLPSGLEAKRFLRITLSIGFMGGQEKTIEYDNRATFEGGEVRFRQYVERDEDEPPAPDGDYDIEDAVNKQDKLKVHEENDISYSTNEGTEVLYLVTWDYGRTIRIVDEAELRNIAEAVRSLGERTRTEDISDTELTDAEHASPPTDSNADTNQEEDEDENDETAEAPA